MRLIDHRVLPFARLPEVMITCDDAKVLDVGAHSNEANDVLVSKLSTKSEKSHRVSVSSSFSFLPICYRRQCAIQFVSTRCPLSQAKENLLQDVDLMLHFRDIHLCKVLHAQLSNRHRFL